MKLTIVREDGYVAVDGVGYSDLDISKVNPDIHAVQFNGDHGWIEYVDSNGDKPANEPISDIERFQYAISRWQEANIAAVDSTQTTENYVPTYAENRASGYPPIGDQLDALFHAGAFPPAMASKIQEVKDKYPKG
jgi:hypothetical protein